MYWNSPPVRLVKSLDVFNNNIRCIEILSAKESEELECGLITTLDVLKCKHTKSICINYRCLITTLDVLKYQFNRARFSTLSEFNNNIRCIEINKWSFSWQNRIRFNNNIRCIEIRTIVFYLMLDLRLITTLDVLKSIIYNLNNIPSTV